MARRLLPIAIAGPVVLGWLAVLGERAGLYATAFGTSLHVVSVSLLLGLVVLWNARSLVLAEEQRERSEDALRRSEASYRDLFENANDIIYTHDLAGNYTSMNQAAERITGYSREEAIGANIASVIAPEYLDLARRMIEQKLTDDRPTTYELEIIAKDGRRVPIEVSTRLIYQEGTPIGIEGVARDNSERRRAAVESARLGTAVEQTGEAVMITDADGNVVYVNPAFERLTGYACEEVLGRNPRFLNSGRHDAEFYRSMWETLQRGDVWSDDIINRRKDGSLYEAELVISPVRDASGRIINYVELGRDVTRERQMGQALRASEERFRALVENAFDAIALAGADGTLLYTSPGDRAFNLDPPEVVGRNWAEHVHPGDLERCKAQFVALLQEPNQPATAQARVRGRDGSWRWVEAIARNLLDNPRVQAIVVNSRDITERKRAEEELNRSREQLRALSARLHAVREEESTRIAREIHDELGQMLTRLKLDLAWLRKRVEPLRPPFQTIEKIASMAQLIDTTIHSVRKIASDLRPGVLDDFGLPAAIEWQAQDFQARTGIRCEFRSSRVAAANDVAADAQVSTALFRILQESLTNVVRHAQATRAHITLEERAGQLVMEVADDGRGITAAEGLDPRALGLLGMRERAQQLGGQVAIHGMPGRGTTVTVCIPLGRAGGSQ